MRVAGASHRGSAYIANSPWPSGGSPRPLQLRAKSEWTLLIGARSPRLMRIERRGRIDHLAWPVCRNTADHQGGSGAFADCETRPGIVILASGRAFRRAWDSRAGGSGIRLAVPGGFQRRWRGLAWW